MQRLFCLIFLSFFSLTVLAGDGAVSIKTEPRDAQVFLDGELKATSTPVVLQKVKPGKHTLEAKAGDKQANKEIFVPEDGVISVTLTLEGSAPVIPVQNMLDYYQPKRDSFETEAEFAQRKQQLREQINAAVTARKSAFQAGTATLDKAGYDINTGHFPVKVKWSEWAKELGFETQGSIEANRDEARALWREGQEKAVYVDGNLSVMLMGLDKNWLAEMAKRIKRYVAYPNGTALDMETGLLWMRCSVGQTWDGKTCQGKAKEFKWKEAKQQTANFVGYSDWRIPTIEELRTLTYCSNGEPAYFNNGKMGFKEYKAQGKPSGFDWGCAGDSSKDHEKPTIVQSVFPNTPSDWFWSGSPYAAVSSYAWYVYFYNGYDDLSYRFSNLHVRLVRDGQ
ncbi:Lcl domain-containing protein [Candidatus Venteria ishoeyi]|uniref:PEGA domain protein n=1 Tax=Candidatus Venteria ishoeyi TaxID=1899563 RepID=A0A1H6FH77_9GAMM|nr:DUF1566 domain-containing protein [Candidatus Venteria ishoeyi]SEH09013.1 PEGA domain protein [Candidatus Venteria ishoeyi]